MLASFFVHCVCLGVNMSLVSLLVLRMMVTMALNVVFMVLFSGFDASF